MKIGEWDNLGKARGLIQRQLGDLRADEYAAYVNVNEDNGRMRVLVATDIGLLDFTYTPGSADPSGDWILRGQAVRWGSLRGLRLQTDAQIDEVGGGDQAIWRLVAEEPKIELVANSRDGGETLKGLLDFARACLKYSA
ncbi:MAG: hypothetical protein K5924_08920 [Chloroflexi bacterium]|nr:hypothetical protein [Chloroflexota bacterium]